MSDLHRAVAAEIKAFTPDRTPPVSALKARRRSRDRRRHAVAGAALSVVAVTGIAAASASLTGTDDRMPTREGTTATDGGPVAPPGASAEAAARLCADTARAYDGQVVGAYPTTVQAVRDYMKAPPSGPSPAAPGPNGANPFPPGWSSERPDAAAAACYVDAEFPTPGPPGTDKPDRALIMAADGATAFIAKAGQKSALEPAPLPPAGTDAGWAWTGATICLDADLACVSLDADQAQRLDAAIDTAVPASPDSVYCQALGPVYTVQFQHPLARTVAIIVRTPCGPMEQGDTKYLLDKAGQDQVEAIYQEADSPSSGTQLASARVGALAVGDSVEVTLAAPCGVPPLLVDDVPYLATGYAAPGTNPPGWGTTQQGRLQRITDDSLIFIADGSTVRLQFFAAPGRSLPDCK